MENEDEENQIKHAPLCARNSSDSYIILRASCARCIAFNVVQFAFARVARRRETGTTDGDDIEEDVDDDDDDDDEGPVYALLLASSHRCRRRNRTNR